MGRKIVQIAANADRVFAVCDDGSVFGLSNGAWRQLPAVPQGEQATGHADAAIHAQIADLAIKLDLSPAERAALEAKILSRDITHRKGI